MYLAVRLLIAILCCPSSGLFFGKTCAKATDIKDVDTGAAPATQSSLLGIGPENALDLDLHKVYTLAELQAMVRARSKEDESKESPSQAPYTDSGANQETSVVPAGTSPAKIAKRQFLHISKLMVAQYHFHCTKLGLATRLIRWMNEFNYLSRKLTWTPLDNVERFRNQRFDRQAGTFSSILEHQFCIAYHDFICRYTIHGYISGVVGFHSQQIHALLHTDGEDHGELTEVEESCYQIIHTGNSCTSGLNGVLLYNSCYIYFARMVPTPPTKSSAQ